MSSITVEVLNATRRSKSRASHVLDQPRANKILARVHYVTCQASLMVIPRIIPLLVNIQS